MPALGISLLLISLLLLASLCRNAETQFWALKRLFLWQWAYKAYFHSNPCSEQYRLVLEEIRLGVISKNRVCVDAWQGSLICRQSLYRFSKFTTFLCSFLCTPDNSTHQSHIPLSLPFSLPCSQSFFPLCIRRVLDKKTCIRCAEHTRC